MVAPQPVSATVPALDESQQQVADWSNGPAIVYAGPGTGKTTTLVESALARLADGAPAGSILLLTFGRDAAAELRQRLALRIGTGESPRVSTFHAFALDIVLRTADSEHPIRLLSGAEQERAVREIIDGSLDDPRLRERWPKELLDAVRTRGFAQETRAAFAAARALGLAGDEIAQFGARVGDAPWQAIGPVLDEYLESQIRQDALDYAELMFSAVAALRSEAGAAVLAGLRHVYVDEYQDTDTMQVALLQEICTRAHSLVAVGDPDQSIYAFRGADVTNIRDFADDFAAAASARGLDAPGVMVLKRTRRYGPLLRDFARNIFGSAAVPGLAAEDGLVHRTPQPADHDTDVHVLMFDDVSAEAAHIASRIRALVQDGGVAWQDIAVLVRAAHAIPAIERALMRANIPVLTDVRDVRLVDQPAVRVLLQALDVVAGPTLRLSPEVAHELLLSPLCGLDPAIIRGLARSLRTETDLRSDDAIAHALAQPMPSFELAPDLPGAREFEALRMLLHDAQRRVVDGATPHEVLWLLWSGTSWPQRLRSQVLDGGSVYAHRDLDAICELFDNADRAVQRRQGHAGVSTFLYELRAQQVPSETLARRGFRGPSVRLLTAHRSKGLEWDHVFVANVTEGVWPDLRRRSALLDTDRLTVDGLTLPRSRQALFEEERRLFFVACTRARRSLTVSGIAGLEDDAPQPSRFLDNPVTPAEAVRGRPTRIDSAIDLVAALRRAATSEHSTPALRAAAIERLRDLAQQRDDVGEPLFAEADWRSWWGAHDVTENSTPIDAPDAALYVRGSSLQTLTNCSLRWLLEQKVHAEVPKNTALVFGSAIHALADAVVKGGLPPDVDLLAARLRAVWNHAGYESAWQSERDFEEAIAAIGRFLAFHRDHSAAVTRSEVTFDRIVEIRTPSDRVERLRMRGSIDRVEIVGDGTVIVFDYKTGRNAPSADDVDANPQLRFYQLAVERGLLDDALPEAGAGLQPGGGALVQLRVGDGVRGRGPTYPKVQQQPPLDAEWSGTILGAGLDVVRSEGFVAVAGSHCDYCPMKVLCPLQPEGRQELT